MQPGAKVSEEVTERRKQQEAEEGRNREEGEEKDAKIFKG
jgi:hypothetical protein